MRLLFVGERPSKTAALKRWVWGDLHLSSKTLLEALAACQFPRERADFINVYCNDGKIDLQSIEYIQNRRHSSIIIGMGKLAQRALTHHDIGHIEMIHPAARGRIRKRELYQEHVRQVIEAAQEMNVLYDTNPELMLTNVKI